MTTMFYNSVITMAQFYRSIVNTGTNIMSKSYNYLFQQTVSEEKNYVKFCKHIETIEGNNYKQKYLYETIYSVFKNKYKGECEDGPDDYYTKYLIPKKYKPNEVKETCDNKLKELMKTDEFKDTILDFSFFCAYNMFVDILTQTMDILDEICTLRLKSGNDDDFRRNLIDKFTLLDKFILSVNFILKSDGIEYKHSFLHNFESISVDETSKDNINIMTIRYNYYNKTNQDKISKDNMDVMEKTIPGYYKVNNIVNKNEIYKFENTTNYTDYYNIEQGQNENLDFAIKVAINALALVRCKLTKINYFSQMSYYGMYEKKDEYGIVFNNYQKELIKNLSRVKDFKKILPLEFDTLSMHTNYSILCTYMLSIEQENNIKYLTTCFDEYANMLMDCIQDKYKTAITKFFNDLIGNNKQTDESAKLIYIKQMCLDTVEEISNNSKITEEINPDTNTEAEKLTVNNVKQYYEKKYKSLFDEITIDDKYYSGFKECIKKIDEETKAFLDKQIGMRTVIEDFKKITSLKEEIEKNKKKIKDDTVDDMNYTFATQTDPILFFNSVQAENKSFKIVSAQNKQMKQDGKTYKEGNTNLSTCKKFAKSENCIIFMHKNKDKIANIIKDTIQMKNMIVKVENDAYEFTRAIEIYSGMKDKNFENEFYNIRNPQHYDTQRLSQPESVLS